MPYNLDVCIAYGRLVLQKTDDGTHRVMSPNDRWIFACAIQHGLPLVTNNAKHFRGIQGLTVITEAPGPNQSKTRNLFE